jgi:hypothetical protein
MQVGKYITLDSESGKTYLAIQVKPTEDLLSLVHKLNSLLKNFNRETYFENPVFHISLAVLA